MQPVHWYFFDNCVRRQHRECKNTDQYANPCDGTVPPHRSSEQIEWPNLNFCFDLRKIRSTTQTTSAALVLWEATVPLAFLVLQQLDELPFFLQLSQV